MHRTAAAGSVGNLAVDEVPGVTTGTSADAADFNIHQEELANLVEAAGLTVEASPSTTDDQVAEAVQKLIAERSKLLGELFYLQDHRAVSAWNRAAPTSYFAGVCLDDGDKDIAPANYPDYVPYLLALVATYKDGIGGEQSSHNVTDWAVSSSVATLTFDNLAPEIAILSALLEDKNVHGSYTSWRSITLASAIGNILAGTYAITGVDSVARTVTFAAAVADGGASGSWTVQFFLHKIAGSTSARVFQRCGGMAVSNDPTEFVPGLRRPDRMQGHRMGLGGSAIGSGSTQGGASAVENVRVNEATKLDIMTDGVHGTPRIGSTTDPRAIVGHLYQWARTYVA